MKLKTNWWIAKAQEIQRLADTNNSREFFAATRMVFGPTASCAVPLKSKEGALIKDEAGISHRWTEHFSELLNRPTTVDHTIFSELEQQATHTEMDFPPQYDEIINVIKKLNNNKSAGEDCIPPEAYKYGGHQLADHLHQIILKIWDTGNIPQDFRDALIVTIFKKGEKSDCGNYRGISLLSIAGKILAKILLTRLMPVVESLLPESQCGFRPTRGTTDMIFAARQLQEKSQEHHQPLYMAFFDLTKAFDSIDRQTLWKILRTIGCPEKFVSLVQGMHDEMSASVLVCGTPTAKFPVSTGVKQGCVMAPTLFNLFLSVLMKIVVLPQGVAVNYRIDGKLFNIRRLQAKTKIKHCNIVELQYADDAMVVAHSEVELQAIVDAFTHAYNRLGLQLNAKKTKVLFQAKPGEIPVAPNILTNGELLETVDHFPYLGSYLSNNCRIDHEVTNRLQLANCAFGKLSNKVFVNKDIKLSTKLIVYKAMVVPCLLYAAECWNSYRTHIKQLENFHQRALRRILNIKWEDRITNNCVLDQASTTSIEAQVIEAHLRWIGHIIRMPDHRLPKQLLYGELPFIRSAGGQKKRFKDTIRLDLAACHLQQNSFELLAQERATWRSEVKKGIDTFERDRAQKAEDKRRRRLQRAPRAQPNAATHCCQICGRYFGARIALFRHTEWHDRQLTPGSR